MDSAAQRIYVTDTLRNKVYILDMQGSVLQTIGERGKAEGEFNYPTELRLDGPNLIVVDAMNFRVQVFDRSGTFQYAIGKIGDSTGAMFRPKAVGIDSEGDLYVVDGLVGSGAGLQPPGATAVLLRFDRARRRESSSCRQGCSSTMTTGFSWWTRYNRRVQVFHYFGLKQPAKEGHAVKLRILLAGADDSAEPEPPCLLKSPAT